MRRHPALIPLSHDHHHALVAARRLKDAADGADPAAHAAEFVQFFRRETVPHFREEEEAVFPLLADREHARPLVIELLLEHQRLHALVAQLDDDDEPARAMREIAGVLEAHVRREERQLFPLVQEIAGPELDRQTAEPVRGGPVWGHESDELNATLLEWSAGGGSPEHVNDLCDVLVFVVDGSTKLTVDGEDRELAAGEACVIPRGARRAITAGRGGTRYLTVHRRRPPLQIARRIVPPG